ncbi:MAG: hypothetical protein F6J92_33805 [Symploca sp. SIO1A3]|nr:hypothetical protein [Symploca sp. SIO1A3]
MLKSLFFQALRLLALTLLITQISVSHALAQEVVPPETTNLPTTETVTPSPVPTAVNDAQDIECEQSTTEDCVKIPQVSTRKLSYPEPPHPYDMEAIEKFDAELYGEGN